MALDQKVIQYKVSRNKGWLSEDLLQLIFLESQMWVEVSEFTIKDLDLYPIQVLRSLTCGAKDLYRVKVQVLYSKLRALNQDW